jgi:V/A-type H+/Na+-transporting ATPase subunit D
MANKINIAATKTNLIQTKKTLSLTQEGFELLDEKRSILMLEITRVAGLVENAQSQLYDQLKKAYEILDTATVIMGRNRLEELSLAVNIESDLKIFNRRLMGVNIPEVSLDIKENAPYYSLYDVSVYVDQAVAGFKEVLSLAAKLAEKEITLLRLAQELRKTIRKVNALEKIYLPYYHEAVKHISDRLDEESREAFSMLKLIKARKE